jgi:hypothetical protein
VLTGLFCANPSDVRWQSRYDFPVSNKKFYPARDIHTYFIKDNDSIEDFSMLGINDTLATNGDTLGDTVGFSVTFDDTAYPAIDREGLDPDTLKDSIGPIPIDGVSDMNNTIALAQGVVPGGTSLTGADTISLTSVYAVTFHPASTPLEMDVTNNSGTTIDRLIAGIETRDGTVIYDTAFSVADGARPTLQFDLAGRALDSMPVIHTGLRFNNNTTIGAGASLATALSLNGMTASALTAVDSLFSMTETYTNNYEITDSMRMDYIDIREGFFRYNILNGTGLELRVAGVHNGLWITSSCIINDVDHRDSLYRFANPTDSANAFSGYITVGTRNIPARDTIDFGKINISQNRMLPVWLDTVSVTRVSYTLSTVPPTGKRITITEHDSFKFIITPVAVNFQQLLGTLTETRVDTGDTQFVEIPFPWNDESKDSLRGNFILNRAVEEVTSRISIPEGSFLDTLDLHLRLFHPESTSIVNDTVIRLFNVRNDSTFNRSVDITDIVNTFPDSLGLVVVSFIPKGSRARVINNQSVVESAVGGMTVNTYSTYNFKAFFDWEIRDTATLDLGYVKFPIDDMLKNMTKIEDKRATFNINTYNRTNVHVRLYALLAPDTFVTADNTLHMLADTLDTLTLNRAFRLMRDTLAADSGYVNLFGTQGIYVPQRESGADSRIELDNTEFTRITGADSCAIRWIVRFIPDTMRNTAMSDTDYIQVDSWIHVEGINSVDSLFSWGDE